MKRDGRQNEQPISPSLKPTLSKRKIHYSVLLASALLFIFAIGRMSRPEIFALALHWTGRTAENYSTFAVTLTNTRDVPVTLDGVQFEWIDQTGKVTSCHAIRSSWCHQVKFGEVVTTSFAVPSDAKKVRVLICGSPNPLRQWAGDLAMHSKLPWRVKSLMFKIGLSERDVHSAFPWVDNPIEDAAAATGDIVGKQQ